MTQQQVNILIICDEESIRKLLVIYLEPFGYHVDTAGDAEEALRLIETSQYNLLILDVALPGMDGKELYGVLTEREPRMSSSVIFHTGGVVDQDTQDFLLNTGRPVIEKPYPLNRLHNLILDELNKEY